MPSTLVDAGIIIAALNGRDRDHAMAVELIRGYKGTLLTTWPAVAEACAMMPVRRQARVIEWLRVTATDLVPLDDGIEFMERAALSLPASAMYQSTARLKSRLAPGCERSRISAGSRAVPP